MSIASLLPKSADIARKLSGYVRKNYGYYEKDPAFFWMKNLGRFELARSWVTKPRGAAQQAPGAWSANVTSADSTANVVATLNDEGYYVGLKLSPTTMASLRQSVASTPCYAERDPKRPFLIGQKAAVEQRTGRKIKVASYFDQQEEWPAFAAMRDDPALLAIAEAYLGCKPVYLRSELAWSFPTEATTAEKIAAAQVFHCDINDYKILKFFFYLSDVGPGSGPHAYIKKGPLARTAKHQLLGQRCASVPDEELIGTYPGQMVTVCGGEGLGFVGDPYYFHRGATPVDNDRLLMQVEFGRRHYSAWYFNFKPIDPAELKAAAVKLNEPSATP